MTRAALIAFAFLCLLAGILSAREDGSRRLAGHWRGEIGSSDGVYLHIIAREGELSGRLELGGRELEVERLTVQNGSVTLIAHDGTSMDAALREGRLIGFIRRGQREEAVTLQRVSRNSKGRLSSWSLRSATLFRKLGKVQDLFARRQTSTPTAARAPI